MSGVLKLMRNRAQDLLNAKWFIVSEIYMIWCRVRRLFLRILVNQIIIHADYDDFLDKAKKCFEINDLSLKRVYGNITKANVSVEDACSVDVPPSQLGIALTWSVEGRCILRKTFLYLLYQIVECHVRTDGTRLYRRKHFSKFVLRRLAKIVISSRTSKP